MKKILPIAILALPVLAGCQGKNGSATLWDPNHGTLDTRKVAKECIDIERGKRTEEKYHSHLCNSNFYTNLPYATKDDMWIAVTGYVKLLKGGENINRISLDQATGKKPLKLTGKKSVWDQRTQTASLTDPYQIKKGSESNEVRFKQQYDGKYLFVKGYVSSIKEDSFWLERGFARGFTGNDDAVKCEIRSSDRRFTSRLNKGDEVVAFGRYKYNNFMGLRGELTDCVWSARTMRYKNFMSTLWLETIDRSKAQKLIRSAPMYQGTIVEYREPVRDLDKEGKDAFRKFLDG